MHPISKAVQFVGGVAALARHLGITPPAVHQWLTATRQVPAERCPAIEKLTDRTVRCEDMRPDVDWGFLRVQGLSDVAVPLPIAIESTDASDRSAN